MFLNTAAVNEHKRDSSLLHTQLKNDDDDIEFDTTKAKTQTQYIFQQFSFIDFPP